MSNLSEEEKQAIEILKQEPDFSLSYYKREKAIDIVLNLINKQQKEIEAYKCLAEENENCILNHKCGNDYMDCSTCLKKYIKEIENE